MEDVPVDVPDLMAAECKVREIVAPIVGWLNEGFLPSLTAKSEPTSESEDWRDEKSGTHSSSAI